jgi:hypothetical protein
MNNDESKASLSLGLMSCIMSWCLLGTISWITAIACAGKDQGILGLVIAAIAGPLYWVFYFASGYCA